MQRLKTEVRQRIYAAALAEFRKCGYADASVRVIAENADISLGNIYRYFANKEALYLAVVQPFRNTIKEFCEEQYAILGKTCEELSADILKFIEEHAHEFEIVVKGNSHYELSFMEFMVEMTSTKIARVVDEKMWQFGKQPNADGFYKVVAGSFLNAMIEVFKAEVDRESKLSNLTNLMLFYFGQPGKD